LKGTCACVIFFGATYHQFAVGISTALSPSAYLLASNKWEQSMSKVPDTMRALFAVARHFHLQGWTVEMPGFRAAPPADVFEDYRDEGDLFISQGDKRYRIEVKTLSVEFTSAADWPFKEVFVTRQEGVDRDGDSVFAYVSVNQSMTHMVVVRSSTKEHWCTKNVIDHLTKEDKPTAACPLEHVSFHELRAE
jgi:hypothetical protein